jgi:Tol biopolymer transport system component
VVRVCSAWKRPWTPDGTSLFFNGNGRLQKIAVNGGDVQLIDTDFANRINYDHSISPDGTTLAITDQSQADRRSIIYTLPIEGGPPTRITQASPSYGHGWSPDGKTLAFAGERDGNLDIYTIAPAGGAETGSPPRPDWMTAPSIRPTGNTSEFRPQWEHPDLAHASGRFQPGAGHPDEFNNWFPHISPDGQRMAFLTYDKDVSGHPENKDVMLRDERREQGRERLNEIVRGQGTINVPSWSPDSQRLAFVSYQLLR